MIQLASREGVAAPPAMPQIDSPDLRRALGQFATGVTVVICRSGSGSLVGLTANSFTSVSLDPPLVLWSLRKQSSNYEAFRTCDSFIINVLAADQAEVARQFSSRIPDRFQGIEWRRSPILGLPIIEGVSASFECRSFNCQDAGDHSIFIGALEGYQHEPRRPLLFHAGGYITTLHT